MCTSNKESAGFAAKTNRAAVVLYFTNTYTNTNKNTICYKYKLCCASQIQIKCKHKYNLFTNTNPKIVEDMKGK